MMFSVFCPTHDSTVLLTRRNAIGLVNTLDGPVLRWRCGCGHEGVLHDGVSTADTNTAASDSVADGTANDAEAARIAG